MLCTSLSFPWVYYTCLLSCFNGALAYQGHGFSFPRNSIVSFTCDGSFVAFSFVTLVGMLAAILHIFRYGVRSCLGMRLRVAFWLF